MKRKMLAAGEDLVDRISEIAKREGSTLFGMVNDILELVIRVENMGLSLSEVVDKYEVLKAAKEAGFILGLESLWYDMAELAYKEERGKALKSWFEAGVWLAKRYTTGEVKNPFASFKKDIEAFTWNAPEFTMEEVGGEVSVRIMSPRFPESYTALLASFLEGALETFGYKIADKKVLRGAMRLRAVRGEADEKRGL